MSNRKGKFILEILIKMSENTIGIEELRRNISRQRVWLNNDNKILIYHSNILRNLAEYLNVFITGNGQILVKKSKLKLESEA